jgi:hypothetical protein
MEPSGRNRWQPAANGPPSETAQIVKTVAVGCETGTFWDGRTLAGTRDV